MEAWLGYYSIYKKETGKILGDKYSCPHFDHRSVVCKPPVETRIIPYWP